eukprot:TRINITY_DN66641_c0_g1_i1.p1 TRINITY_DN66641_c0_g1~~TRINITY_DN66641_c0_g1_i1.p1  ORF type:complete len:884 (-),score=88.63 TRINITY_DN66641_c0_g1_i1:233-2884(-)
MQGQQGKPLESHTALELALLVDGLLVSSFGLPRRNDREGQLAKCFEDASMDGKLVASLKTAEAMDGMLTQLCIDKQLRPRVFKGVQWALRDLCGISEPVGDINSESTAEAATLVPDVAPANHLPGARASKVAQDTPTPKNVCQQRNKTVAAHAGDDARQEASQEQIRLAFAMLVLKAHSRYLCFIQEELRQQFEQRNRSELRRNVSCSGSRCAPVIRRIQRQCAKLGRERDALAKRRQGISQSLSRSCPYFAAKTCPHGHRGRGCPHGLHQVPCMPHHDRVLVEASPAKKAMVQTLLGFGEKYYKLVNAWQVCNARLTHFFEQARSKLSQELQRPSDMIDAFYGLGSTAGGGENLKRLLLSGFRGARDPYFSKNPVVVLKQESGLVVLCKLLLGEEGRHHRLLNTYYELSGEALSSGFVLPMFLVQLLPGKSLVAGLIREAMWCASTLAIQCPGGLQPCPAARRKCAEPGSTSSRERVSTLTQYLWVGWLHPRLVEDTDAELVEDVQEFLASAPVTLSVEKVIPDRHGASIGAFVQLAAPGLSMVELDALAAYPYRGLFKITVEDASPPRPDTSDRRLCPRLLGQERYCRGWNIQGHFEWYNSCRHAHPVEYWPTLGAEVTTEEVNGAKLEELRSKLQRYALRSGESREDVVFKQPRLIRVQRIRNAALEELYQSRRLALQELFGCSILELELWHGTSGDVIEEVLHHGLQPPSDTHASPDCPRSGGGRHLRTTICGNDCQHCRRPHLWRRCHMFGLGIYLADLAFKSHAYTQPVPRFAPSRVGGTTSQQMVYSLLRCQVCLANPYLIAAKRTLEALHDACSCRDPGDEVINAPEAWSNNAGHDAYFVRGTTSGSGVSVGFNEYILFHPYQALPVYRVDYVLD